MEPVSEQQHFKHYIVKDINVITSEAKKSQLSHQIEIVKNWKPWTDVWPLKFGRVTLGITAAISGAYINYRCRRKLKLRDFGELPTVAGLVTAPFALSIISHQQFVINKLLLLDIRCPMCLETKSAMIHTCTSLLLPMILAPIANFSIGVGLPSVPRISNGKEIYKVVKSIYRPLLPVIATIFTFNALLASFITYQEIRSFLYLQDVQYLMKEEQNEKTRILN